MLGPFSFPFTAFPLSLCLSALLPSLHMPVFKRQYRPYQLSHCHLLFLKPSGGGDSRQEVLVINDGNPIPSGSSEEETLNSHISFRKGWKKVFTWTWGVVSWLVSALRSCLLGYNPSDLFPSFDNAVLSSGMSNPWAECQKGKNLPGGATGWSWEGPDYDWRGSRTMWPTSLDTALVSAELARAKLSFHWSLSPNVSLCLCPHVFLSLPVSLCLRSSVCVFLSVFSLLFSPYS